MKVRFSMAATLELEEAAEYYDKSNPGLGDELYASVKGALAFIAEFPEASPKVISDVRRHNLKRFPYYSIYRARNGEIVVGAVGHGRQKPLYWRHRNFDGV